MDITRASLESKIASNKRSIIERERDIAVSQQDIDRMRAENSHLEFALSVADQAKDSSRPDDVRIIHGDVEQRTPLRITMLSLIEEGESLTIESAWNRITSLGLSASKATVNSTLHNMVKRGDLEKPSIGQYRRPIKGEAAVAMNNGGFNSQPVSRRRIAIERNPNGTSNPAGAASH